jgi:hypothetical protein
MPASKKCILLVLINLIWFHAIAQEKIETDRPDQTESAFTVPKDYFQFEFGFNRENDKQEGISTVNYIHPTSLLKYGINENAEFRVEFQPYTFREKTNNSKTSGILLEPLEVGLKLKLLEEHAIIPKTSLIIHTTIPPFSSKRYHYLNPAPSFRFAMQNTLSEKWALGYNTGMEWDGETAAPTYIYTFAPGFTINDKWSGYFEVFGFIKKDEAPQHSIDGGLYYFPSNNVKLDVSAGFGLTKEAPDFYVALGVSFRFKR